MNDGSDMPEWQTRLASRASHLFWYAMGVGTGAFMAVVFAQLAPDSAGLKFLAAMIGPALGALGGFTAAIALESRRERQARLAPINELRMPLANILDMLKSFRIIISYVEKGDFPRDPYEAASEVVKIIERETAALVPKFALPFAVNRDVATWGSNINFYCDLILGSFAEAERRNNAADRWDGARQFISELEGIVTEHEKSLHKVHESL